MLDRVFLSLCCRGCGAIACAVLFFSTVALADDAEPDIASHWHALVPIYPDDPRVPGLRNMNADMFVGDLLQADVASAGDGSVYWMCNLQAGAMDDRIRQVLLVKYDDQGERLWHHVLTEEQAHYIGAEVAVDSRGNVYVAGTRMREQRRAVGALHGVIVSFTAEGRPRWVYEVPHEDREAASACRGLTAQGDRVYFAGNARGQVAENARRGQVGRMSSSTDGLIGCVRADGRPLWLYQIQETPRESFSAWDVVLVDDDRIGVMVNKGVDLGRGNWTSSAEVMCFSTSGRPVWQAELGRGDLLPPGVAADEVGNYIWSIVADGEGGLYAIGNHDLREVAGRDRAAASHRYYLTRVSAAGEVRWACYLPTQDELPDSLGPVGRLEVDSAGNALIPAVMGGRRGALILMRHTPEGELHSIRRFAERERYEGFHALAVGSGSEGERVTVAGRFYPRGLVPLPDQPGITAAEVPPSFYLACLDLSAGEDVALEE